MLKVKFLCSLFNFCIVVAMGILNEENDTLQREINELMAEQVLNDDRLADLEKDLRNLSHVNQIEEPRLEQRSWKFNADPMKPAFSARTSHQIGNLGDYQIIIFDDIITNVGTHYDNRTGCFRCPESGTYVFYVNIVSVPNCYVTTQIAKNGQGVAWTFSADPANASSGRNMVTLQLQVGDVINVRINGDRHEFKNPQIAQLYCAFSGFRLN